MADGTRISRATLLREIAKGVGILAIALVIVVAGLRDCGWSVEKSQSAKREAEARDTAEDFPSGADNDDLLAVGWAACMESHGWVCSSSGRIPHECRHFEEIAANPFTP